MHPTASRPPAPGTYVAALTRRLRPSAARDSVAASTATADALAVVSASGGPARLSLPGSSRRSAPAALTRRPRPETAPDSVAARMAKADVPARAFAVASASGGPAGLSRPTTPRHPASANPAARLTEQAPSPRRPAMRLTVRRLSPQPLAAGTTATAPSQRATAKSLTTPALPPPPQAARQTATALSPLPRCARLTGLDLSSRTSAAGRWAVGWVAQVPALDTSADRLAVGLGRRAGSCGGVRLCRVGRLG
ncbi:hypothetical protein GCM10028799_70940 [Kribbella italica]